MDQPKGKTKTKRKKEEKRKKNQNWQHVLVNPCCEISFLGVGTEGSVLDHFGAVLWDYCCYNEIKIY